MRDHADLAKTPLNWPSAGRYGSYALTVPQVTLRLGIAEWTIRREIRAGRLRAVKHTRYVIARDKGGLVYRRHRWLILWRDVEAWWSIRAAESVVPQQRGVDRRRAKREASTSVGAGEYGGSKDRPLS